MRAIIDSQPARQRDARSSNSESIRPVPASTSEMRSPVPSTHANTLSTSLPAQPRPARSRTRSADVNAATNVLFRVVNVGRDKPPLDAPPGYSAVYHSRARPAARTSSSPSGGRRSPRDGPSNSAVMTTAGSSSGSCQESAQSAIACRGGGGSVGAVAARGGHRRSGSAAPHQRRSRRPHRRITVPGGTAASFRGIRARTAKPGEREASDRRVRACRGPTWDTGRGSSSGTRATTTATTSTGERRLGGDRNAFLLRWWLRSWKVWRAAAMERGGNDDSLGASIIRSSSY
mmetsp:Transcript_7387/g.15993  ORF Transcript_7387/g.15993 Transcript_7387/m.15993 type:complete len:289 (+) Transcript_7387:732-1598(+)